MIPDFALDELLVVVLVLALAVISCAWMVLAELRFNRPFDQVPAAGKLRCPDREKERIGG